MQMLPGRKVAIPSDLASVTSIGYEVDPREVGLGRPTVKAIAQAAECVFAAGMNPAFSICIHRHGQPILNRAMGWKRGLNNGQPELVQHNTPVCLFSGSKAITAVPIHMLAERGQLALDTPVAAYIPEFAQAGKEQITVRHVLSHRGGIPRFPDKQADANTLLDWDYIIEMLCKAKPLSTDGSKLAYHAITGGYILGELVKRVDGRDIRQFLAEEISEPMGFDYFSYGLAANKRQDAAKNYVTGIKVPAPANLLVKRVLHASFEEVVDISNTDAFYDAIIPAGNLYANGSEICQFYDMLMNGGEANGKRLLKAETVRAATRIDYPQHDLDWQFFFPVKYTAGMFPGGRLGLFGWRSERAYGHLGFQNILTWADPARGISVSILNTGKNLLGPHLLPLVKLVYRIGKEIKPL